MHDTLATPLPASWLSTRLGVDGAEIERLRCAGELFAVRPQGAEDGAIPRGSWARGEPFQLRYAMRCGPRGARGSTSPG